MAGKKMGNCKDCKYWRKPKQADWPGHCDFEGDDEGMPDSWALTDQYCGLLTGPMFGCVCFVPNDMSSRTETK